MLRRKLTSCWLIAAVLACPYACPQFAGGAASGVVAKAACGCDCEDPSRGDDDPAKPARSCPNTCLGCGAAVDAIARDSAAVHDRHECAPSFETIAVVDAAGWLGIPAWQRVVPLHFPPLLSGREIRALIESLRL